MVDGRLKYFLQKKKENEFSNVEKQNKKKKKKWLHGNHLLIWNKKNVAVKACIFVIKFIKSRNFI